jgi:hypothetical protein
MLRGISNIISHLFPVVFLPRQIGRGLGEEGKEMGSADGRRR